MPTCLIIGQDVRLGIMDDLAAIAELDAVDADGVRSFEATWQGQTLRVETPLLRDEELIQTRSNAADFLMLVIAESDGIMAKEVAELEATPDRLELVGVAVTNLVDDAELRELVRLEVVQAVARKRPRWEPRFVAEDCTIFFHILKAAFFGDCL
jgi:hypothetical protein